MHMSGVRCSTVTVGTTWQLLAPYDVTRIGLAIWRSGTLASAVRLSWGAQPGSTAAAEVARVSVELRGDIVMDALSGADGHMAIATGPVWAIADAAQDVSVMEVIAHPECAARR